MNKNNSLFEYLGESLPYVQSSVLLCYQLYNPIIVLFDHLIQLLHNLNLDEIEHTKTKVCLQILELL